jgi:hypothetical protein
MKINSSNLYVVSVLVKTERLLVHAMKTYRENRGITPLVLNLDVSCSSAANITSGRFTHGNQSGF